MDKPAAANVAPSPSAAAAAPVDTAAASPSSQSTTSFLQNRTVEEIITKWTQDLDTHLKEFRSQAVMVAKVDDALIAQGEKIAALHKDTVSIEGLTKELTLNLEYLENQQKELEQALSRIDSELSKYYENPPQLLPSDIERDRLFTLAESTGLEIAKLDEAIQTYSEASQKTLSSSLKESDTSSNLLKILETQMEVQNWAIDAIANLRKQISNL